MSEENVEIVRSIYEALNRGDWDAATRPTDPNFEVTFSGGRMPGPIEAGSEAKRAMIRANIKDTKKRLKSAAANLSPDSRSRREAVPLAAS